MKKFNLKSGVCGFMAGVVVATAVPVLAYNGSMDILATFKNIKIIIDGTELTPRDSAGNVLEPFIYNGSTYLPVRAVGEAVGKDVSYDSNNNYVYINSPTDTSSGNTQSQGTKLTAYNTLGNCIIGSTTMSGNEYEEAVVYMKKNVNIEVIYENDTSTAYYSLQGAYTSVSGLYGTLDGSDGDVGATAELSFYGDGRLLQSYTVTSGQAITNFTLNTTGVSQLTAVCENGDQKMTPICITEVYGK